MAGEDFSTERHQIRLGALECIASLALVEKVAEDNSYYVEGRTLRGLIQTKQAAVAMILNDIGELNSKAKGYLLTMAEYIYTVNEAGVPALDKWKPFCAMTNKELEEQENEIKMLDEE